MSPREMFEAFEQALARDSSNSAIRFKFGWWLLQGEGTGDKFADQDRGTRLIASCFDEDVVDQTLPEVDISMAFVAAMVVGRFRHQIREHATAARFFDAAFDLSRDARFPRTPPGVGDACAALQRATALDPFPRSVEAADAALARAARHGADLLDAFRDDPAYAVDEIWLGSTVPGAGPDPYVHCVLTLFPLSFYYRADVAATARQNYELTAAAWPRLRHVADHVRAHEAGAGEARDPTACVRRRIRLGVVSATFQEAHSVSEDFGGVLERLDRAVFDVTYILVHEKDGAEEPAQFLDRHAGDARRHYAKGPVDIGDGAWIVRLGKEIGALQLDLVLYLDLTMSTFVRRLGMMRLAPVQLNTHGHPVTSGHPRATVQHFVSWAEAELPKEEAQGHYTEELQLIPKGKIHQYYSRRVLPGMRSRIDGMPFGHLTRRDLGLPGEDDVHLYVCMQKPFKVFPEFDELACGVLRRDPRAHVVLHKADLDSTHEIFRDRLRRAGCDLPRVTFLPVQPPHRLLYLYSTAHVVLDSYPAGGCTTTREALELGKAVVTWPARLLGGRWTLGLYRAIGLDEEARAAVVATSGEDYVAKATALGMNAGLRARVERSILAAVPNLFARQDAVEEWQKILLRVSPVRQCPAKNSTADERQRPERNEEL